MKVEHDLVREAEIIAIQRECCSLVMAEVVNLKSLECRTNEITLQETLWPVKSHMWRLHYVVFQYHTEIVLCVMLECYNIQCVQ